MERVWEGMWFLMKNTRIITREITMCEVCDHFRDDNDIGYGNARYSCGHPDGPGGELNEEIVIKMKIHEKCPLPKKGI